MDEKKLNTAEAVEVETALDAVVDATSDTAADTVNDEVNAELILLREENARLKAEMERAARLEREGAELKLLFPEVDVESLPDEVMRDYEGGMLLAAAYSLYDKRRRVAEDNAKASNRLNGESTPGDIENDGQGDGSFTLDDIRRMPREEVRNYLERIYRSLEKR